MPLYEYQCEACSHLFEVIQKYSDPVIASCPTCGGPVRKLLSSPAIQFKGSGWYITDYARKGKEGGGQKPKEGGGSEAPAAAASDGGGTGSSSTPSSGDSTPTSSSGATNSSGSATPTTTTTTSATGRDASQKSIDRR